MKSLFKYTATATYKYATLSQVFDNLSEANLYCDNHYIAGAISVTIKKEQNYERPIR